MQAAPSLALVALMGWLFANIQAAGPPYTKDNSPYYSRPRLWSVDSLTPSHEPDDYDLLPAEFADEPIEVWVDMWGQNIIIDGMKRWALAKAEGRAMILGYEVQV